jgi:glycosyltransferase involved in cell wall biosynthesis
MCGLPFAAFNVGWVSNLLQKYIPECFAEPGDTVQLYHLINDLINEQGEKIIERTSKGRELAGNLFDIKDRIPILEDIYRKILS